MHPKMSRFRERFELLYNSAVYRVAFPDGVRDYCVGKVAPPAEAFGMVTAFNPPDTHRTDAENTAANEELRSGLEAAGWRYVPSSSSACDGSHEEPGFAVFGASAGELLALALEFGQAAIAWFDGSTLSLHWADEPLP